MKKTKLIIFGFIIFIILFERFCFPIGSEEEKFYIATKAFNDGFYDVSISLLERFIKEYPHSQHLIEAKLYIAKCYYFKENYPKALEVFNEIVSKLPSASSFLEEIYYWLAEIYAKGKNFNDSNLYAEKLIKNFPNSQFKWWTLYRMANNNLELSNKEKAEEIFKQIISETTDIEVIESVYPKLLNLYFQKGDYPQTIAFAEKYLKEFTNPQQKLQGYFYLAESYYALGDFEKAIFYYEHTLPLAQDQYFKDLIFKGLGFSYLAKTDDINAKKYISKIQDEELYDFSEGIYYFKKKDYTQALEIFDRFLKKFPQSKFCATIYLNRANTLYELGRINDAISDYKYILDNFKNKEYLDILDKTHYGLAWCYLKNSEFKKAIEEFKNTLKYTDNPIVKISSQIQIADTYQEAGDYNKALEIYNNILKTDPHIIYADYIQFQIAMIFLKTKKPQEALIALKNLQKNFPSSKLIPETQYYLAVSYFSIEQYQEAEDLLEDFMEKFQNSEYYPKAHYLYAKCFFNKKEYKKAIEIFSNILSKFSNNKEIVELVYIDMGNAYLNLSLYDEAKKLWETFLSKFPTSNYAGYIALYLGGLCEKEQNYQEAEFYYRKVIDEYKNTRWEKEALFSLAHLFWLKNQLDDAQKYFVEVVKLNEPISIKAKLYLAKLYTQKKDYEKALELYDELILSKSNVWEAAIVDKAILLKDMQEYAKAISLFQDIIKKGIDSPKIRMNLGYCLEKLAKYQEALEEYFVVIYSFDDEDYKIKTYFHIARVYEKQEKFDAAKEIYNKIISSKKDEAKVAQVRLKELENKKQK
ncbi:MAG: tetratricopeptide repeat protein [Candidatus Omnitrophica bacterium]|nr:tetratricopeptide repeat protein [Candidatus Omnitrophota bacterium]